MKGRKSPHVFLCTVSGGVLGNKYSNTHKPYLMETVQFLNILQCNVVFLTLKPSISSTTNGNQAVYKRKYIKALPHQEGFKFFLFIKVASSRFLYQQNKKAC